MVAKAGGGWKGFREVTGWALAEGEDGAHCSVQAYIDHFETDPMSSRQHAPLIVIDEAGTRRLAPISMQSDEYNEARIRDLIFAHPETIPVQEIDPSFGPLVPVCTELSLGPKCRADALFFNSLGMPTILECKLWHNPEARREVIGQILDYASKLKRWSYLDLHTAIKSQKGGVDLIAHMRANGHADLDELAFVDNVTRHLTKGRILLLVLGDGIREGVESIGAYLQEASGLHFSFGLVEAKVYKLDEGRTLLQSRVIARTVNIVRKLVDNGPIISGVEDELVGVRGDQAEVIMTDRDRWLLDFWTELLDELKLDLPDQQRAKPESRPSIFFPMLPGRGDWGLWITARIQTHLNIAEVFLGYDLRVQPAIEVMDELELGRNELDLAFAKIGLEISWTRKSDGKLYIAIAKRFPAIRDDQYRAAEIAWFSRTINAFVNVLSPRITDHWNELTNGGGQA